MKLLLSYWTQIINKGSAAQSIPLPVHLENKYLDTMVKRTTTTTEKQGH